MSLKSEYFLEFYTKHFVWKIYLKIITIIKISFANIIRSRHTRKFWRKIWMKNRKRKWGFSLLEIKLQLENTKTSPTRLVVLNTLISHIIDRVRSVCQVWDSSVRFFCRTMYITMSIYNVNKHRLLLGINKWYNVLISAQPRHRLWIIYPR